MKKLLFISLAFCALTSTLSAQTKYFTKTGTISFYSKAPMEDIEANNKKVTSILDASTGIMDFAVLIKSFEFEKALMQEHFNENYMESDKFPKATFKGNVTNIKDVNFSKDGKYPVSITGKLTIHGQTKDIPAKGNIEVKAGKVIGTSEFKILLSDYSIEIPGVVKDKIAKEVRIVVTCNYEIFGAK